MRARRLPVDDVSFRSWLEHWDCPLDNSDVALAMCAESSTILGELEGERHGEWDDFLASPDLGYSLRDHCTLVFCPTNVTVRSVFRDVTDFEWAARLVAPDFAAIYSDVFMYFADRSHRVQRLHWREFEELLSRYSLRRVIRPPSAREQPTRELAYDWWKMLSMASW